MSLQDKFNAKTTFDTGSGEAVMYRLDALQEQGIADISRLPYSIKVLLEAASAAVRWLRGHRSKT